MYLIDTNVISELRKTAIDRADPNVLRWVASVQAYSLYLSPITLMERRNAKQGQVLRRWLTSRILPDFANRLLPIHAAVASRCAQLHARALRSERDAWIAATALVHNMTVVTRNVPDFAPTGVALLNPWDQQL